MTLSTFGYFVCCLNCRQAVETLQDWESYTYYCPNCGDDMNDPENFIEDDD